MTIRANDVLAGCERVFGDDHPATLAMLVNSAAVLRVLGDVPEARRRDERAMTQLCRALGGPAAGQQALAEATAALVAQLGDGHPNVLAAREKRWVECDIEPPAT